MINYFFDFNTKLLIKNTVYGMQKKYIFLRMIAFLTVFLNKKTVKNTILQSNGLCAYTLLWKARLVNVGHMTDPTRYDPFEKTAPTVSLEIVYIILNIAVSKKLKIESFDVPGAYLNAELQPGKYHKMRINKNIAALLMQVDPKSKQYILMRTRYYPSLDKKITLWIT